ncbi:Uncharacterised protein [Salmonella bongori]|uniref:Uncharacterized protein n=1 Tax=Salmonella bongori N268-08 TaxID=1197719 RepID=S5N6G1_SALBN|nr:hypothetical protein A464_894 [Salmonella bongori N268-08]AID27050.1 hypothetical protein N643_04090 [Salmonella bongori serovar 48:z41:-- str. RKS3044]VDZ79788.1 Uncharacterised protein [Salmonella bongori]
MRIMPPPKTLSIGSIQALRDFYDYRFDLLILSVNILEG